MKKGFMKLMRGGKPKHFHVTIFGSARIKDNDKYYKEIYKLAKMIGENGMDIVTGGGPGIMEAANKGHKDGANGNGTHSIGLGVNLPHEQGFNDSVRIYKKHKRFSARLDHFMTLSNAVVIAPGGVGTLLELFYTWQLVQVKHLCNIPIILLGDSYKGLVDWLKKEPLKRKFFNKEDLQLLYHAKNAKEAMKIIDEANAAFKRGGEDFCLNYKKYRLEI